MFIYKQYTLCGSFHKKLEYYNYINIYRPLVLSLNKKFLVKPEAESVYNEYFSKFFTKAGLINFKVYKKRQHLNKQFFAKMHFYLNYFLSLLFFDEKKNSNICYKVNFFLEKNFYNSASLIANLIEIKVKQGFFIGSVVKKMLKYLFHNSKVVLGYKMYFSGRYAKKLRNFAETYQTGRLSLSTSNFPLDYFQMAILTRIGIVGLKV